MRSMLKIQSLHFFFLIFVHDLERLHFLIPVHGKQQKKKNLIFNNLFFAIRID